MMTALHQNLHPAHGGKFVEFLIELFPAQNVVIFVLLRPVERAELAVNVANVRVVDVAIDDVSHDLTSAIAVAGTLRQVAPHSGQRTQGLERLGIECERFRPGNALTREHLLRQRPIRQRHHADNLADAGPFRTTSYRFWIHNLDSVRTEPSSTTHLCALTGASRPSLPRGEKTSAPAHSPSVMIQESEFLLPKGEG